MEERPEVPLEGQDGETYDMISVATIAELGGADVSEAEKWVADPSFPNPVVRLSTRVLYARRSVEKWLLEHGHRGLEIPPAP